MKLAWIVKRRYTHRDLLGDRFGRLYHYPVLLGKHGYRSQVLALDYFGSDPDSLREDAAEFLSIPLGKIHLWRAYRALRHALKSGKPEAIVASGDTHMGWLGLHFAQQLDIPFIFDLYDDYRAFASNRLPGMPRLFAHLVRRADLVLCASRALSERMQSYTSRTIVLSNGVDRGLFRPMERRSARAAIPLAPDIPVVGYFGSMSPAWGTATLIEACRALRTEFPRLHLLLAGHNRGVQLQEPFITYLGMVPQQEVPRLISACDVVTMPYHRGPQVDVSNACKLAEYLACGVPVVATRVADLPEVLAACPRGLCEPGDVAALVVALRAQLKAPCTAAFDEALSWESGAVRLARALSGLGRRSGS